jgi:hypothetical protein
MDGTTEVVPCYKAHKLNTFRGDFSFRAGANLDPLALLVNFCRLAPAGCKSEGPLLVSGPSGLQAGG